MRLRHAFIPIAALLSTAPAGAGLADEARRLSGGEVRRALTGKLIAYSPPGWADAGVHEEFHPDGSWRGLGYSRGPVPFSGGWSIRGDQLCVRPAPRSMVAAWFEGSRCRYLWRDRATGPLRIEHLDPRRGGLLQLAVKSLKH